MGWTIIRSGTCCGGRSKINIHWKNKYLYLLIILFVIILLNISIYGYNILKYKSIIPNCNQILTEEQCNLNPIISRNNELNYPEEKLSLFDVLNENKPDPFEYTIDYWVYSILKRIYGIMGHKSYFPDILITFFRLYFIFLTYYAVKLNFRKSYVERNLFIVLVFYILSILWVNYNSELDSGFLHVGIQGRYLFPVIGVFYVLIAKVVSSIRNSFMKSLLLFYSIILFFMSGPLIVLSSSAQKFYGWFV